MKNSLFCVGGATIDIKLKSIQPLISATSNPVTSSLSFGGVARNVAENLANLKANISLQTVIGNDNNGKTLLEDLNKKNIDTQNSLIIDNAITAHYYAVSDQQSDLAFALADMAIFDNIPLAPFIAAWNVWNENDLVFMDTNLTAAIIQHAINISKDKKLRLCIDPVSIAKSAKLPYSLDGVFLLKPNQLEAQALTDICVNSISDAMLAGNRLLNRGVANVVISLGEMGYVIVNQEMQQHFPVLPVASIVDVNGAGDAFIAGLMYGLQQQSDLATACKIGAQLSSLTLQTDKTVMDAKFFKEVNYEDVI